MSTARTHTFIRVALSLCILDVKNVSADLARDIGMMVRRLEEGDTNLCLLQISFFEDNLDGILLVVGLELVVKA